MPLLDAAKQLNKEFDAKKQQEAEENVRLESQALQKAKDLALYNQHASRWFNDLYVAMESCCSQFNGATKDQTKHLKVSRDRPGSITIEFVDPVFRSIISPVCRVSLSQPEMALKCEFNKSHGPETTRFNICPKEDTIEVITDRKVLDVDGTADFILELFSKLPLVRLTDAQGAIFMTTTDDAKSWKENGTTDQIGWGIVAVVALIALSAYGNTRGVFNIALLRLFLLGSALIGLRLSTASERIALTALRSEAWKRHIQMSWENDEVDRCMRRRERRLRIRMRQETDDGLSDWGRELRGNSTLRESHQRVKDSIPDYSGADEYEDIFAMEENDEGLLAAWIARVSAESVWQDALRSRQGVHNSAS